MRDFEPSKLRDREILVHVKWASRKISNIIRKYEDQYSDVVGDASSFIEEMWPDNAGTSIARSKKLAEFVRYNITSRFDLVVAVEERQPPPEDWFGSGLGFYGRMDYQINEGPEEELKEFSGILLQMFFRNGSPNPSGYYNILMQQRVLRDSDSFMDKATGKRLRPHGWRKRESDDLNRILFHVGAPYSYEPLDFLIQIEIFLIKDGFLTGPESVLRDFRKYVFSKFKETDPNDKSVRPSGYYDEREGESRVSYNAPKPQKSPWRIDLREVDKDVLRQALQYIVKAFNYPYNPTTFQVYVRKTIAGILKSNRKSKEPRFSLEAVVNEAKKRKITKEAGRSIYANTRKKVSEKALRRELISFKSKKREITREGARKWLYRELKKGKLLEQIFTELF